MAGVRVMVLVLGTVATVQCSHGLHTSWSQLETLWRDERQVVEGMKAVVEALDNVKGVMQRYIASWEEVGGATEVVEGDPAAAYALLRHVATGWHHVDTAATQALALRPHLEQLATRVDRQRVPNGEDVAGASEGLARLALVYRLNTTALSMGALTPPHTTLPSHALSVSDLASIGLTALTKGYYGPGVEFLGAARARAHHAHHTGSGFGEHYTLARLERMLNTAVKLHDHVLEVRGPRSLTHATADAPLGHPTPRRAQHQPRVVLGSEYLRRHANRTWMVQERHVVELQQVERLCRGEDLRHPEVTSQLTCRYMHGGSAWLLLAPFKVEVVSIDPYIALVYDVITPREAEEVKGSVGDLLETPQGHNGTAKDMGQDWTLKHTWVEGSSSSPLHRLGLRLSHLTGVTLDSDTSEHFMVADYGVGGRYAAHRDTLGPSRAVHPQHGERLASFLTYLHAPTAGGATVFPWVGAGVRAVQGAAVVWWNLLASHEHDFLTRHAACPVFRGRKWIANKWAGYTAQWRKLPCPAHPAAKIRLPTT